jgi:hypothetical protein
LRPSVPRPDASADDRNGAADRPERVVAGVDLHTHVLRSVVNAAGERADLDVVRAAQACDLGKHCGSDAEPALPSPEGCADSVREDRHAELRFAQRPQRVEALREGVDHHGARTQFDDAMRPPDQRLHRAGDVGGIANSVRDHRRDRAHPFLQRTPGRIAKELVVLDQVGAARSQSCRDRGELPRREPERRLDDRADEHLVRRRERRAG